jgi:hypothetical protein
VMFLCSVSQYSKIDLICYSLKQGLPHNTKLYGGHRNFVWRRGGGVLEHMHDTTNSGDWHMEGLCLPHRVV